ncbi:hypothetical protein K474DRAFT_1664645 [Panus rudis PR-1116 ss-1]|nr:hypothetical protein K474DRAFT_1664645 [Panus rudis PR-1116 ss-1]
MTSKSYMRQVMEIKPSWLLEGSVSFLAGFSAEITDCYSFQSHLTTSNLPTWNS